MAPLIFNRSRELNIGEEQKGGLVLWYLPATDASFLGEEMLTTMYSNPWLTIGLAIVICISIIEIIDRIKNG
jgi:hypothetical protein